MQMMARSLNMEMLFEYLYFVAEKNKALFVGLGAFRAASSFLCGALAFGMDPWTALGYTSLMHLVTTAEMIFVRKNAEPFKENCRKSAIFSMILSAFSAWKFLAKSNGAED